MGFISIHAAREGGDGFRLTRATCFRISIHAAREGGDLDRCMGAAAARIISIHAAREGGDGDAFPLRRFISISIHAAREGGDEDIPQCFPVLGISIHAAREGGDLRQSAMQRGCSRFQSTPPVKAATVTEYIIYWYDGDFNPRRP